MGTAAYDVVVWRDEDEDVGLIGIRGLLKVDAGALPALRVFEDEVDLADDAPVVRNAGGQKAVDFLDAELPFIAEDCPADNTVVRRNRRGPRLKTGGGGGCNDSNQGELGETRHSI
jgi:hypothetical protein